MIPCRGALRFRNVVRGGGSEEARKDDPHTFVGEAAVLHDELLYWDDGEVVAKCCQVSELEPAVREIESRNDTWLVTRV